MGCKLRDYELKMIRKEILLEHEPHLFFSFNLLQVVSYIYSIASVFTQYTCTPNQKFMFLLALLFGAYDMEGNVLGGWCIFQVQFGV